MPVVRCDRADQLALHVAVSEAQHIDGLQNGVLVAFQQRNSISMLSFCILLFLLASFVEAKDVEADMSVPEIIAHWGYPVEDIAITTSDGYILHVHRIRHGKNDSTTSDKPRPVLFLQHGLLSSSSCWVANLPNESFGFVAADMGFDVWMGNVRGVHNSVGHTTLNHAKDKKFWAFSWDEMAAMDLEAMIDYALTTTNTQQLYYVGHSQGSLVMFAKLAKDPDFNHKIKKFFAVAPIVSVEHLQGLLGLLGRNLKGVVESYHDVMGDGPFFVNDANLHTAVELFGQSVIFFIGGPESNQMNNSRVPVYLSDVPGGTSIQNILHCMQLIKSGRTQMYDYGNTKANMQHYGQKTPPLYDISKITTDVYLYWSDDDWLAPAQDIKEHLLPNLNPQENIHVKGFNHDDFLWGLRAADEIYIPILKTILADILEQCKSDELEQ